MSDNEEKLSEGEEKLSEGEEVQEATEVGDGEEPEIGEAENAEAKGEEEELHDVEIQKDIKNLKSVEETAEEEEGIVLEDKDALMQALKRHDQFAAWGMVRLEDIEHVMEEYVGEGYEPKPGTPIETMTPAMT